MYEEMRSKFEFKQTNNNPHMKTRKLLGINLILLTLLVLPGCGDGQDGSTSGATYRITLTLQDVNPQDDFVSFTAVVNNQSGMITYPAWRLNNVSQGNLQTISLDKNDFSGGTTSYVIETVDPVQIFTSGIQIINYGSPLSGAILIQKDGVVVVDETIDLVGDNTDFTYDYSF